MDHFFEDEDEDDIYNAVADYRKNHPDQDEIAAAVIQYQEDKAVKAAVWGNISRCLIIAYIFLGGGYEIIAGISRHHIQASFIFSFMSALIFIGRVFYGFYSGATRTVWADICGVIVMLTLSVLHVVINGTFL